MTLKELFDFKTWREAHRAYPNVVPTIVNFVLGFLAILATISLFALTYFKTISAEWFAVGGITIAVCFVVWALSNYK